MKADILRTRWFQRLWEDYCRLVRHKQGIEPPFWKAEMREYYDRCCQELGIKNLARVADLMFEPQLSFFSSEGGSMAYHPRCRIRPFEGLTPGQVSGLPWAYEKFYGKLSETFDV